MESLVLLFVIAAVAFYFVKGRRKDGVGQSPNQMYSMGSPDTGQRNHLPPPRAPTPPWNREKEDDWLAKRWAMADQPVSERPDIFPHWFFDPVTDRQLAKLEQENIAVPRGVTKGKASDLLGLGNPIGYKELSVLKFFKKPTRGVSETQGRHIAALLLSDPANKAAWEGKPPVTMQREFFRWFGITMPKALTSDQATIRIREEEKRLEGEELDYWNSFESVVNELDDPDVREDYEVKKVPLSVIREAVLALRAEGISADDIECDLGLVTEKILAIRPDLMRG